MDLQTFAVSSLMGAALVFARIGSAFLFMPGFGEQSTPVRQRLILALVLSLALTPAIDPAPVGEERPAALILLFGTDVLIGLWIGLVARTLLSALQFAGYQIALVSGLANALAPTTGAFEGATSLAALLVIGAIALIFVTDTHHLMLGALVMSYEVFAPGPNLLFDLADQFAKAAQLSLYIGLSIAGPFFVAGLVLNTGMGLANRMMAALPVFFVAQPILIGAAFALMLLAVPAMMRSFLGPFADWLTGMRF